jgi:hypothetical protein
MTRDPLVVNTKDGAVWQRRAVTRDGHGLYAVTGSCCCPEYLMATLAELAEHGIAGSADVLPVPVGPEPSLAETLEKRTELLHIVQATARRLRKEANGRKAHGDRLKTGNAELTAELHQARTYIRAVEQALADKTPFWPRGQLAVLRTIGWLRNSLDDYRGRVDTAEAFARRTQARINALLVEPVDLQGCALCGVPEDGHGVRVSEGFEHEWQRPTDGHVRERRLMQQQLERSASGEARVSELAWLRARVAELEAAPTTVYRAEHPDSGITLGHYGTAAAARKHCEETERRSWPTGTTLAFDWIEDDEDRVAELVVTAGQTDESTTGYLVTALELDSEYDAGADE